MVFEGKNKSYGAYELRKDNTKTTLIALGVGTILFSALMALPLIDWGALTSKEDEKITMVDMAKLAPPPPPDKPLVPPPPPRFPDPHLAAVRHVDRRCAIFRGHGAQRRAGAAARLARWARIPAPGRAPSQRRACPGEAALPPGSLASVAPGAAVGVIVGGEGAHRRAHTLGGGAPARPRAPRPSIPARSSRVQRPTQGTRQGGGAVPACAARARALSPSPSPPCPPSPMSPCRTRSRHATAARRGR